METNENTNTDPRPEHHIQLQQDYLDFAVRAIVNYCEDYEMTFEDFCMGVEVLPEIKALGRSARQKSLEELLLHVENHAREFTVSLEDLDMVTEVVRLHQAIDPEPAPTDTTMNK